MREVTLTVILPVDVDARDIYYWDVEKQEFTQVAVKIEHGVMEVKYAEGLETRVDALETELREEVARKFDVAHETFVALDKKVESLYARTSELDNAICCLRERIDEIEKTMATDNVVSNCVQGLNERLNSTVRRIAKLEKPCVVAEGIDAETFKKLAANKIIVAGGGEDEDILRRLCRLENRLEDVEKRAVVAEGVRKQLAEDIKATQGRINKICEETLVDA